MSGQRCTEEQAYRELIEAYHVPLQRLCGGYEHDVAQREELFQEILLALWRALPSFRGDASERTFVFRVAHNVAATHVRHVSRSSREGAQLSNEIESPGAAADEALDARVRVEKLLEAIRHLPTLDRQIMLLYLEELPQQEIASVMGLSRSNVSTRLLRARKRLKSRVTGADS